jgi:4-diphosphocytidyl-2-C-methyl-D-erythritol kinase
MIHYDSPAKINLFLDILGRRPDGFHNLETCFVAVGWRDGLTLEAEGARAPGEPLVEELVVTGPAAEGVPTGRGNLVVRALEALEAEVGRALPRLRVRLHKRVPHGAGLGGGSSNAATALRAANRELGLGLGRDRLAAVASRVGSDCAFFVTGGIAMAGGRGELLEVLAPRPMALVIAKPDFAVSTREAYGALRPADFGRRSDVAGLRAWLRGEGPLPRLENSFEGCLPHAELAALRAALVRAGARLARLSGSGSATFGLFDDMASAEQAAATLAGTARQVVATGAALTTDILVARRPDELDQLGGAAALARLLHEWMQPYHDATEDIERGIGDALDAARAPDGFVLVALIEGEPAGVLVMLPTVMRGYVPENLLLYLGVDPARRGFGVGSHLVAEALDRAVGGVALHVEPGNPAERLYERFGFARKYVEMRRSGAAVRP